jgi:hypothetical protein
MKMIRSVLILVFFNLAIFADSPITSTEFAAVYAEEKIIVSAIKARGIVTPELMEFLSKPGNPIGLKMAVINQLGWQNKIKDNSNVFMRFLSLKHRTKNEEEFKEKANGDELLALAYLRAMDDYQEVSPAIKYAEIALSKNPKSFTFNLITGLIKAQKAMDSDWCEVYKITNAVRENTDLTVDIKSEATKIIYKYTDGYKEFCK